MWLCMTHMKGKLLQTLSQTHTDSRRDELNIYQQDINSGRLNSQNFVVALQFLSLFLYPRGLVCSCKFKWKRKNHLVFEDCQSSRSSGEISAFLFLSVSQRCVQTEHEVAYKTDRNTKVDAIRCRFYPGWCEARRRRIHTSWKCFNLSEKFALHEFTS